MDCLPGTERSFGPRIDLRCRSFDFTLQFEDIILACLPAAPFLLISPFFIFSLLRLPVRSTVRSMILVCKMVALVCLITAQLTSTVLRELSIDLQTSASLAADSLCVLATGLALALSFLSYQRASRPSTVVSLYISAFVILGIARARTLWLIDHRQPISILMMVELILSVVVLIMEVLERSSKPIDSESSEKSSILEDSIGFWDRTCFTWLAATFRLGYAKVISVQDLPTLDGKLRCEELLKKLLPSWAKYNHRGRNSLLRACFRGFLFSSLSPITPRLCLTAFTFSQPFLIDTTVKFVSSVKPDKNYGRGLAGAWALVYLGIAVSNSVYQYQTFRFTTRLRGGLTALIYLRTLETREVSRGNITPIALVGTDVERIIGGMQLLHEVWASLLDIAIASWLLEDQLSLAALAPIVVVLVCIGITTKISSLSRNAQRRWIEKVQERLRVTSTVLGEMKAIKMLGVSRLIFNIVQQLRSEEIKVSRVFRKLLVFTLLLSLAPINLAPIITFAVYAIISVFWKHTSLLTAQAFTSLTLISLLTNPVVAFVQALPMVIECLASFDRIQEYCSYNLVTGREIDNEVVRDEIITRAELEISTELSDRQTSEIARPPRVFLFRDESYRWEREGPCILKDLSVEILRGTVTAIIGPVGGGKSSFLSSLLGGMIHVRTASDSELLMEQTKGNIAYCSQQTWLENGTILQNIIGGADLDRGWYDTVKWACSLDVDISQLLKRDSTRIGSKGLNLSGGQKQRIALARAIYSRRDIVILDDVFSGMDSRTASVVSSRLLGPQGLLPMNQKTVVLATHNTNIASLADNIVTIEDGRITEAGSPGDLSQTKGYASKVGLTLPTTENLEESIPIVDNSASQVVSYEDSASINDPPLPNLSRKNGQMSVYSYYLTNVGYGASILYILFLIIWIFCTEFSNIWIKWWSETNSTDPNKHIAMYVSIYTMLGIVGSVSIGITAWFAFISIISNTAAKLHTELLGTTLGASFHLFTTTDSGELLNRFSQDMELIDMDLPMTMVNYTSTAVSILAKVVILAVFTQYLGATIPLMGTVLYFLQRFYLQTSRQVRLLGIEAQAPLYTHITESLDGAVTIRAAGWETQYQQRNYHHIDTSQRPLYVQRCIQAWLAFVLNIMVAVLAIILVTTVVTWHDKFSAGSVGLSLTMVIGFGETLVRLVRTWTNLESSVGAVARIKRFAAETESEDQLGRDTQIPDGWPLAGALDFKGVTASHGPESNSVVNRVSLSIQAGEHIAICGRTGSGKSSLILCLLQMLHMSEGRISIDGVDLATVKQEDLRKYINCVPQEPFLLPGTVRLNVDPLVTASNEEIVSALERVGIWSRISEQGGINKEIDKINFSVGQKQLLCLARAMVKKSKILILDEAMSSLDSETESAMQGIIDTEFRGCTVLAVMHRLGHISRYDKIALLENGELIEFGAPTVLMAEETQFAELVRLNAY